MNLFLLWACRQFLAQRHCRLCRHCLSSTLARPCRCLCEQAGVGGDIIPNQFPQHASHISLSTGSFYHITFKFLFFFFYFFIILFFCFIFLYPTSPHDMQVIFHCHLNLFITTPTLFNIGHRHKSQVSIDDGKWKNNEISLHLQSISAWLRFCTRNWHSDSSVLLEIWQNVSRTECKKSQPKICSGFQLGGCKDEGKDLVVYKGRPTRVIFVLFVKADMSLHQVWGKERSNNVEWPSWPQTNPHPTSQQTHDLPQYSY